jgi:hypothetical protein
MSDSGSRVVSDLFGHSASPHIADLEKKLGVTLPRAYRSFLEEHNGAQFSDNAHFPIAPPDEDDGEVSVLFGLANEPHAQDLRYSGLGLRFKDRVPKEIIAIGENEYHERIALSVAGSDCGTVYLWRPGVPFEDREEDNIPTRQYLHVAARDFDEFWQIVLKSAEAQASARPNP